jgi:hypothetical protein
MCIDYPNYVYDTSFIIYDIVINEQVKWKRKELRDMVFCQQEARVDIALFNPMLVYALLTTILHNFDPARRG